MSGPFPIRRSPAGRIAFYAGQDSRLPWIATDDGEFLRNRDVEAWETVGTIDSLLAAPRPATCAVEHDRHGAECIHDYGHNGPHRDADGEEWGPGYSTGMESSFHVHLDRARANMEAA